MRNNAPSSTHHSLYIEKISRVKSIRDRIISDREKANTVSADGR